MEVPAIPGEGRKLCTFGINLKCDDICDAVGDAGCFLVPCSQDPSLRSSSPKVQVVGSGCLPPCLQRTQEQTGALARLWTTHRAAESRRHHIALTHLRPDAGLKLAWCEMIVDCFLQIQEIA